MHHIEVGVASKEDHQAVLEALWGSYENMVNSPAYIDIQNRIEYLSTLIKDCKEISDEEIKNIPRWNLWKLLYSKISRKFVPYVVERPANRLIQRYLDNRKFPINLTVSYTNQEMNKFLMGIKDIVIIRNKTKGITSDIYLENIK